MSILLRNAVEQGSGCYSYCYNSSMSKDITFQLDPDAGADILQNMALPLIKQSANAIGTRARSMASSISTDPPEIKVSTQIGRIRRGSRAIGIVSIDAKDAHQMYIGRMAIIKSRDAGRV